MRVAAGLLISLGFLALMLWVTAQESGTTCHVCLEYRGRTECVTASAADERQATQSAVMNACAMLSSGVTDGIQCDQTPPRSVRCEP